MSLALTQSGTTQVQFIDFYMETCCNCGIPFMMPTSLYNNFKRSGSSFYCPNGHGQYYTKTKEMELREKLEEEKKKRQEETEKYKNESRQFQELWQNKINENKKLKAEKNRIEKRAKSGVCICCNRSFKNLIQHMQTKHPNTQNGNKKIINRKPSDKLAKR